MTKFDDDEQMHCLQKRTLLNTHLTPWFSIENKELRA
jgi:hypothetical protein